MDFTDAFIGGMIGSKIALKKQRKKEEESKILCPKCNTPNDSNAKFCKECGTSLKKQ